MKDYYYILGIKKEASLDEVKKAYRKLSMKFHPDKNDGDEFFAERFKEIQEAYETLSDSHKRQVYDGKTTNNNSNNNTNSGENFNPVIEYFKTNKTSFEYDEEVTFTWKTINSNKVSISPFGQVQPIGQKIYKIKDFKNASLTFEIIAENSNIGRRVKNSLSLKNKSFIELYSYFRSLIESEKASSSENRQSSSNNTSQKRPNNLVQHQTDKGIVEIPPCINFKGQKVYLNGQPAPNGRYKYGFLSYFTVENGIIIRG
jgi:curved DNA-binding protein CbpA